MTRTTPVSIDDARARVERLVERFRENVSSYRNSSYNETQTRREFIDPLFKALGWDVDNEAGYAEAYKDVIHEDAVKVGGVTKAPDYCFRIGGQRKFFVEAKKPAVDMKNDPEPYYQLRRYAFSAKLPLSIITDFEELAVVDCRQKPSPSDKASKGRIRYWHYEDYLENFEEIYETFSKPAVLKGSFDRYVAEAGKKRGTGEVDKEFLKEIEEWRSLLARNIALRNPALSQRELNTAVQLTIDRIIFLRICEDRGIEEYGVLHGIFNGANVYGRLLELFRRADERYNSGLFHFQREKGRPEHFDDLTPGLTIDDKVLRDILKRLYYPESPYEFSVLPADILGQVYEQFLGKVIRLTAGHRAVVEDKPEVKKAGGVYYTPTYIVDYIVRNTVGRLLGCHPEERALASDEGSRPEKPSQECHPEPHCHPERSEGSQQPAAMTPRKAEGLRILDPACGSGSFLIGAFQYLMDWHRDWYGQNDPEKWAKGKEPRLFQGKNGWQLTTAEKKRILLNNIYGVDIDPAAVEVTKLSLLLKVLEGESAETLGRNLKLFHERALPDLGDNIKCGNSLIGSDFYEGRQMGLMDEEERLRINAFDWEDEFPEVFSGKNPGFDAVIGNPPYLFITELDESSKEYYEHYYQTYSYRFDVYGLFIEKTFSFILCRGGQFGFIIPHTMLNNDSFEQLRHYLLNETTLIEIIDLGPGVFQGAKNETMLLFAHNLHAKRNHRLSVIQSNFMLANLDKINAVMQSWYVKLPKKAFLVTADTSSAKLLSKLHTHSLKLGDLCTINQGLRTGNNERYLSKARKLKSHKPVVGGKNIARFRVKEHQFVQYERDKLDAPRKESIFTSEEKIIVQEIRNITLPRRIIAAYDSEQLYCLQSTNVINMKTDSTLDLKYLLGLINSKLLNTFFRISFPSNNHIASNQLAQLPIRPIDFSNHTDKARHVRMVELVEQMLELNKQLQAANTAHQKTALQRQIDATDRQIDQLVYELYDLTAEEIKIVEGSRVN